MEMINYDCPRCGTKGAGLKLHHPGVRLYEFGDRQHFDALATCQLCDRSMVVTLSIDSYQAVTLKDAQAKHSKVEDVAPTPPSTAAPEFTPENAGRFFEQGMENLPRNWDAAGTMFRKALEAGLRDRWPKVTGTLYQRIEKVAAQGGLTEDMKDWAHQIRLDGNEAAHEDQPISEGRAQALSEFTKLFLLYVFNLPGMLAEARGQSDDDDGSAA